MDTVHISLPDELRALIKDRVASGEFASDSDYITSLLRDDQKRLQKEHLEELLRGRLEDKDYIEVQPGDVQRMRDEFAHEIDERSRT